MEPNQWRNKIRLVKKVANLVYRLNNRTFEYLWLRDVREIRKRINGWYGQDMSEAFVLLVLKTKSKYDIHDE